MADNIKYVSQYKQDGRAANEVQKEEVKSKYLFNITKLKRDNRGQIKCNIKFAFDGPKVLKSSDFI